MLVIFEVFWEGGGGPSSDCLGWKSLVGVGIIWLHSLGWIWGGVCAAGLVNLW